MISSTTSLLLLFPIMFDVFPENQHSSSHDATYTYTIFDYSTFNKIIRTITLLKVFQSYSTSVREFIYWFNSTLLIICQNHDLVAFLRLFCLFYCFCCIKYDLENHNRTIATPPSIEAQTKPMRAYNDRCKNCHQ